MKVVVQPRRIGFTLVELLVVIGIIAVLISLLLPALNKARQSGQTLSCLANLRQIGMGITMYAGDNQGMLPPGQWPNWGDGSSDQVLWYTLINPYMGGKGNSWYTTGCAYAAGTSVPTADQIPVNLSPVFICAGANISAGYEHYSCNPVIMPAQGNINAQNYGKGNGTSAGGMPMPQKLNNARVSCNIALAMDGAQLLPDQGGMTGYASAVATAMDYDNTSWALHYTTPMSSNPGTYNRVIPWEYNYDGDVWEPQGDIRWRHQNNTAVNLVFADGHADTAVDQTNFYIPYGTNPPHGSLHEYNFFPVGWVEE